ncbi:hypothetical protein POM88_032229 [Heracleum sosnowskyi]|uniref:ABC-2 type transporter transmembrane domain-containing protein n=1 Tax=Heracleum sosnowskyi TaxID=360622 RepID=A0AAD8MJV2_9APIA|nr:hypothetical protein POM88_032229 [Heracleum sosnowskyi]
MLEGLLSSGFVLARDDVANWWLWGYYSSPMMYGMNAIAVNEFLGHQWHKLVEDGSETIGVAILKSRVTMALTYLDPLGKPQAVLPDKDSAEALEMSSPEGTNENKKKGMILPFEPHSITFDEVMYSVDMPPEMKEQGVDEDKLLLLKGVSGAFRPGVLTALMGVSGAAWLRLPSEVDSTTRKMFVDEVLELVELNTLKSGLVGLPGRTVVCTIHQPSIDIFEAFDELFLMKRGGQEIYVGPVGRHSCELITYFEGIDGVNKIKDGYNPATWICSYWRNTSYTAVRFLFAATIAVMLGSMFWDLGSKMRTRQDLFNAMGSMYAACLFLGVQNASSVQPVVDVERTVFYRERAAGMYSALPYAFAQVLVEIPYVLAQAGAYSGIVYAMIGFEWTVVKFFWIYNPTTQNAGLVEMVFMDMSSCLDFIRNDSITIR